MTPRTSTTRLAAALALALMLVGPPARLAHAADPPELANWKLNLTGVTGYNGLPANVHVRRPTLASFHL